MASASVSAGVARVPLDSRRPDLVVVASCFDDAEACSTALERAAAYPPRLVPEMQAVLRHHLRVPAHAVGRVTEIAAQDGYELVGPGDPVAAGFVVAALQRVQLLDALRCSQERSRMAGLAQRHDGHVLGWDALQPDPDDSGAAN